MKINGKLLLITTFILWFTACKFDLFDDVELAIPNIKIESVENNEVNESEITFTTTEPINKLVDFMGVGMSSEGPPRIDERQSLFNGDIGTFTFNLGVLSSDSTYYFKAFAGNEDGLGKSTVFAYAVPDPVAIQAPCTLTNNAINEDGVDYNTSGNYASSNTGGGFGYGIETTYFTISGRRELEFVFRNRPITGRYKTTTFTNFDQNSKDVLVKFFNSSGDFVAGKDVYIDIDSNNIVTVEFCDLEYTISSTVVNVKGNISTRLN